MKKQNTKCPLISRLTHISELHFIQRLCRRGERKKREIIERKERVDGHIKRENLKGAGGEKDKREGEEQEWREWAASRETGWRMRHIP